MSKRILVIDDDLASVSAARRRLKDSGYEVLVASNAADAEVVLEHDDPVLVILALATDGESGLDICASIRDLAKDPMLPVLMIGDGSGAVVDVASALSHGGDGYFKRPVPWDDVVSKVEAYLGVDSGKTHIAAVPDMSREEEAAPGWEESVDPLDAGEAGSGALAEAADPFGQVTRDEAEAEAEAPEEARGFTGAWEITEPARDLEAETLAEGLEDELFGDIPEGAELEEGLSRDEQAQAQEEAEREREEAQAVARAQDLERAAREIVAEATGATPESRDVEMKRGAEQEARRRAQAMKQRAVEQGRRKVEQAKRAREEQRATEEAAEKAAAEAAEAAERAAAEKAAAEAAEAAEHAAAEKAAAAAVRAATLQAQRASVVAEAEVAAIEDLLEDDLMQDEHAADEGWTALRAGTEVEQDETAGWGEAPSGGFELEAFSAGRNEARSVGSTTQSGRGLPPSVPSIDLEHSDANPDLAAVTTSAPPWGAERDPGESISQGVVEQPPAWQEPSSASNFELGAQAESAEMSETEMDWSGLAEGDGAVREEALGLNPELLTGYSSGAYEPPGLPGVTLAAPVAAPPVAAPPVAAPPVAAPPVAAPVEVVAPSYAGLPPATVEIPSIETVQSPQSAPVSPPAPAIEPKAVLSPLPPRPPPPPQPVAAPAAPPEVIPHPTPSPFPAEGQLLERDLPRLLADLYRGRATGVLEVHGMAVVRAIFIELGRVVGAGSSSAAERLEEVACRLGRVTRAQAREVRALGDLLPRQAAMAMVEAGQLKAQELYETVHAQAQAALFGSFAEEEGRWRWVEAVCPEDARVALPAHPVAIIAEGIRRKYTLSRIHRCLGGPATVLAPAEGAGDLQRFKFSARERRVAQAVDGLHSAEELVFLSGLGEESTYQVLYILEATGYAIVRVRGAMPEGRAGSNEEAITQSAIDRTRILEKFRQAVDADYFEILGVTHSCTGYELKEAYERLSRELQPARFADASYQDLWGKLEEIRRSLDDAYDVLRDEGLRMDYLQALGASAQAQGR